MIFFILILLFFVDSQNRIIVLFIQEKKLTTFIYYGVCLFFLLQYEISVQTPYEKMLKDEIQNSWSKQVQSFNTKIEIVIAVNKGNQSEVSSHFQSVQFTYHGCTDSRIFLVL